MTASAYGFIFGLVLAAVRTPGRFAACGCLFFGLIGLVLIAFAVSYPYIAGLVALGIVVFYKRDAIRNLVHSAVRRHQEKRRDG